MITPCTLQQRHLLGHFKTYRPPNETISKKQYRQKGPYIGESKDECKDRRILQDSTYLSGDVLNTKSRYLIVN